MSKFTIVTTGIIQKVIKENGNQVDWFDADYLEWLSQGNMPDTLIENEPILED